ncbi:MAG: hypothetical protein M3120_07480, partial [Pseudomonadota bacterium]|nr:hypothetical protein [Pseudomonadota bacterium]
LAATMASVSGQLLGRTMTSASATRWIMMEGISYMGNLAPSRLAVIFIVYSARAHQHRVRRAAARGSEPG